MLELNININRENTLVNLHVERIWPDSDPIQKGVVCTYKFFIDGTYSGVNINHPYGDGILLAKIMFDTFLKKYEQV